jgi:hypothetical protein
VANEMDKKHMLSTVDNPYNPFTQFDEWYRYDTDKGHHTLSFLARIVRTSDVLSEADNHHAIESAIEEIVTLNVLGIHKKVAEPDKVSEEAA